MGVSTTLRALHESSPPLRTLVGTEACPVLRRAEDPPVAHCPERRRAEYAQVAMRDLHLGHDLITGCHDVEYPNRPSLRILTVHRDDVATADDAFPADRPVDHGIIGDEICDAAPVPSLDPVPERLDHLRRFHTDSVPCSAVHTGCTSAVVA